MLTFNCARVYVGCYTCGYIAYSPEDDTYRKIHCGYKVVRGKTKRRRLRNIKVSGAQDEFSSKAPCTILQTYVIHPLTHSAIIRIFNSQGSPPSKTRQASRRLT